MSSTIEVKDLIEVREPITIKKLDFELLSPIINPAETELIGNRAGVIGSDLRRKFNQLIFVEFTSGNLCSLDLFRRGTVLCSGTTVLKGTFAFDFERGIQSALGPDLDIWWDQPTNVERRIVPENNAGIINLGIVDFNAITAETLQHLPFGTAPIIGNNDSTNKLVPGDVFAVKTHLGNLAKVQVLQYGDDLTIRWVTYTLAPSHLRVLGSGFQQPEDVKLSADGTHAFVTERTGNLLRVELANANRAVSAVIASGMTAPQQIFLDEAHKAAFVVEFAPSGRLLRIDLTTGQQTKVLSNLENAVGLLLSDDRKFAFISEQTAGSDKGRVSRFDLTTGARAPLATGLINPFFLTFDLAHTAIMVPERDPANRVVRIDLAAPSVQVLVSPVPFRPSSIDMTSPSEILICCDQVIERFDFLPLRAQPTAPLLMGIGNIPEDKVTPLGLADTTVDPAYFYQVKNTPFAGMLPLIINPLRALNDGARFYRVKVDGALRFESFTDERWDGKQFVGETITPQVVNGQPGFYRVRPLTELFMFLHPSLGGFINSTTLTNAMHTIVLEFFDQAGALLETSTPLSILVDNNPCSALLAAPTLNGAVADACGLLKYTNKATDAVKMPFVAKHPNGFATFYFEVAKGVTPVTLTPVPPVPVSGPVTSAISPITETVGDLIGPCNIAGFAEHIHVYATANNGWSRQCQYDAAALSAFVLVP